MRSATWARWAAGARIRSPLHALMNGSFVLQGALIVGGALLVRQCFPKGAGFSFAVAMIALAGAGAVERVAAYPLPVWLTCMGWLLVWRRRCSVGKGAD